MVHDDVIFTPGEIVYLRHLQHQTIAGLFPMRAIQHDAEGLLMFGAEGDHFWFPLMPDGREIRQTPLAEWVRAEKPLGVTVRNHSLLSWHPAGADWSLRFFFRGGRFTSWYANLELPVALWRDTELAGADTVDWDLDVVIRPDRSWRWKDEEEFAARLTEPEHYWVGSEQRVRDAGRQVIKLAEAGVFPFDGTWCDFQPSPHWEPLVPAQPPRGWDRPPISSAY
ncbi:hypothetical protein Rhe02_71730 [Rhizocola hellebori]|uniref:DUF402 domain-containing protein n=1 Tax=Rhizocola hellebori TaxID=1392758 RepID=A0A8J3QE80_9ACTN|nr:DUF402 domain-containing protein [Rhizocola hellebori]GIH09106.1 hypothetical protein Rhe02_71730 [Rhizocola hellebori]